jgi:arylsulfatase
MLSFRPVRCNSPHASISKMSQKHFTRRALLAGAAATTMLGQGSSRLNLLMITNDQHRADCLGCYGNPVIQTPNLDRLAREGMLFENHYVQTPQCVPSRASLHTGRYPHVHRTPSNVYLLPESEETLAKILNQSGFRTAAVGEMPFAPQHYTGGFGQIIATGKEYNAFLESQGWRGNVSASRAALLEQQKVLAGQQFQAAPVPWPAEMDETAFYAQRACSFLTENRSNPFFLHVNFRRPHHPFDPPAPYDTMYKGCRFPASHQRPGEMENKPPTQQKAIRNSVGFDLTTLTPAALDRVKAYYYGMITLNDHYIGVILDHLRSLGLEQNTIVAFNADHGEMLGDHGLLFKGAYMYDEVLRVPLIIRAPNGTRAGSRVADLVEEVDVLPTLLEMLGVPAPMGIQGKSLLNSPAKSAVFAEFPTIKMVRTKDWKLVHYPHASFGELYDLKNDPHELNNLFADTKYPTQRAEMQARLSDWLIDSADPKLPPTKFT